jgi:hypothetical protein
MTRCDWEQASGDLTADLISRQGLWRKGFSSQFICIA